MSKFLFTQTSLARLVHPTQDGAGSAGYVFHWDTKLPGLGLQCRPSGVRTFVLNYRTESGRSKRIKLGRLGRITIDQARELAARRNGDVAYGRDPASEREDLRATKTFGEVFDLYLSDHLEPNRSKESLRSAKRVRVQVGKSLCGKLVTEITDTDVRNALKSFVKSRGSYNSIRSYVSSVWTWGRQFGFIARSLVSPTEFIQPLPSVPQAREITRAEYKSIQNAVDALMSERRNDPSRLLACMFVIHSGCRPIEAVRLRRAKVDRGRGIITLDEHKSFSRTGRPKVFFLTAEITAIIDRAEAIHRLRGGNCEFVFHRRSKQQASNWLAKTWISIRTRAHVDIDLRQMRSGLINAADDAGLSREEVAGITQHASQATIDRHYRVVNQKKAAINAARVTAAISSNVVPLKRAG